MNASIWSTCAMLSLTLSACTPAGAGSEAPRSLPSAPAPKVEAPAPEQLDVAARNARFGLRLLAELAAASPEKLNLAISPVSVGLCLAMVQEGTSAETQAEMARALGMEGLPEERAHSALGELQSSLLGQSDLKLTIANALWPSTRYPIEPSFLQRNQSRFGATVAPLDFTQPSAVDTINRWAHERTAGRIPKILDELPPETVLVAGNAVYFLADWETPFEKEATADRPFTLADGTTKQVPTLSDTRSVAHLATPEFHVVALPYKGGRFEMRLILPKNGTRPAQVSEKAIAADLAFSHVQLELPKWESKFEATLNDVLKSLGMPRAFERGRAQFDRLTPQESFLSLVRHATFVRVDEKGTEAAAVTVAAVEATSAMPEQPTVLKFDRPFAYAIRDTHSGALLFLGVVGDPTAD